MTQPTSLATSTDYNAALLWLMGELKQARLSEVIAAFQERFGDLIPPEHNTFNDSGYLKWDNYVRWARQALVNTGLMKSGGRGIWAITPEGEAWLREYPDGGGRTLLARIRERQVEKDAPTPIVESASQVVRIAGRSFTLSASGVLAAVRRELAAGMPPKAKDFRRWSLVVDGKAVSVKWAFNLVTGLPFTDFNVHDAIRILRRLGLEPADSEANLPAQNYAVEQTPPATEQMPNSVFFQTILDRLGHQLPPGVTIRTAPPEANHRQLTCPAPRSHYELWLTKNQFEIAIHFEGNRDINLKLLDQMRLRAETIEQTLGETPYIEPWGKNWARVYLKRPEATLDAATAHRLADDWLRFIHATLPVLEDAVAASGMSVRSRKPRQRTKDEDLTAAKAILEKKIATIRVYLHGNPTAAPSDEVLCDWVRFCYDFEFFDEGAQLFKLIRPNEVNAWLYERTRRFARICEMRVRNHVEAEFK